MSSAWSFQAHLQITTLRIDFNGRRLHITRFLCSLLVKSKIAINWLWLSFQSIYYPTDQTNISIRLRFDPSDGVAPEVLTTKVPSTSNKDRLKFTLKDMYSALQFEDHWMIRMGTFAKMLQNLTSLDCILRSLCKLINYWFDLTKLQSPGDAIRNHLVLIWGVALILSSNSYSRGSNWRLLIWLIIYSLQQSWSLAQIGSTFFMHL